MAKSTYACPKCGDSITVEGSNRREADWRAKRDEEAGRTCRDCERAEFAAAHQAAVTAAAADPRNADLPALTGSDKQIAWATKIRLEALAKLDASVTKILDRIASAPDGTGEQRIEIADAIQLCAVELRDETESRVWIDSRDTPMSQMLARRMRGRHALCPSISQAEYDTLTAYMARVS